MSETLTQPPAWAQRVARRAPDFIIGGDANPYLRRWWLIPRNRVTNVYLHHFLRSDDDRALHDHPWCSVSVLLAGSYIEHTPQGARRHVAGDMIARRPSSAHRIELDAGPCWTLFLTGPRVWDWGFHCPQGWRPWAEFTNPTDGGATVGRGCDG